MKAIQACGESFYRVYDENMNVVMTANRAEKPDEYGFIAVKPIWKNCGAVGSQMFNQAIEAVRAA